MSTKNRLFSALLLEKLLLHVSVICCLLFEFKCLQCGLLHPASYTARAIHAFPNKTRRPPWPWNIFFWALMAHHTLRLWVFQMLCMYADWRVQCRTSATNLGTRCMCSTLNWSACSVRTGYVFFRSLVFCLLSTVNCLCKFVTYFSSMFSQRGWVSEDHCAWNIPAQLFQHCFDCFIFANVVVFFIRNSCYKLAIYMCILHKQWVIRHTWLHSVEFPWTLLDLHHFYDVPRNAHLHIRFYTISNPLI